MLRNFFQKIPAIVWVILSYTALAILFTWPLALNFSTHLLGPPEDNQQFYWNLWWWQKSLAAGQNPFHTSLLFFPRGTSLLLHTISPLNAVMGHFFSFFVNLTASFNLLIFFSIVMSGVGMYYLALDLVGDKRAAWIAGLIFTFSPRHISHIYHHLNIIAIQFIPLAILCLRRIWQGRRPYYFASGMVLWLVLTFYTDFYNALYIGMWATLFVLWRLLWDREDLKKKMIATALVAFVTMVACAPLIVPMVKEKNTGAYPESGWDQYSADAASFLLPPPYHWLVGERVAQYYSKLGFNPWEATHYVGFSVLVLAAIGWWRNRRELNFWLGMGVFFTILSFGPVLRIWGHAFGSYWPYYWIVQKIPIIQMAKTAGRFSIFLVLVLALAAAFGVRELMVRCQWRHGATGAKLVLALAAIVVVLEFAPGQSPLTSLQGPALYYEIATDGDPGAVVDVPAGNWRVTERFMLYQTIHGKPMALGAVSRARLDSTNFIREIQYTPEFFKEHGLKYLTIHKKYMPNKDWENWQQRAIGARFILAQKDEEVAIYRAY